MSQFLGDLEGSLDLGTYHLGQVGQQARAAGDGEAVSPVRRHMQYAQGPPFPARGTPHTEGQSMTIKLYGAIATLPRALRRGQCSANWSRVGCTTSGRSAIPLTANCCP
ncbi:MAG: hypothetical protein QOF84_2074 [Streptomyces sp.]|nr:hypothetical protein [Streptomyces sp.]